MNFEGKSVLVWGNERSGMACKKLLEENGAKICIISKEDEAKFDWNHKFDYILLSPGVPILENQKLSKLVENGAYVIGEMELGYMFSKSKIFAITGTNGKTTTTTLLSKIFIEDGKNVFLCGNIGLPLSSVAKDTTNESVICLEVSSYQLESAESFHAHVACILNIAPDHLARHLSMTNYCKAKEKIFNNQTAEDFAVLNFCDPVTKSIAKLIKSKVVWFSSRCKCDGAYVDNEFVCYKNEKIFKIESIKLLGIKNLENVLAAVAIAKTQNVNNEAIKRAIIKFEPIEHRIQTVGTYEGIKFVNDSKATNVASTLTALEAVKGKIVLLLGGSDKGEDFASLAQNIRANVDTIIIYGATTNKFIKAFSENICKARIVVAEHMKDAFFFATRLAKPDSTILLSPACASFDEFKNFEERGQIFMKLVHELGGK